MFQVSLVVEECLEKGKKQKGYLSPDVPPHLQLSGIQGYFLDWDSSEATRHRTEAPLAVGDQV